MSDLPATPILNPRLFRFPIAILVSTLCTSLGRLRLSRKMKISYRSHLSKIDDLFTRWETVEVEVADQSQLLGH